jgi:2-polyprenyl-3-methyl-5-hydroxy-6-metoxy-1,4-benzoquinol methylase
MIEFEAIERRVPPDAPMAPLLRALFVRNEWMLRPMLEMLDDDALPAYLAEVERIWSTLHAIRPIDPAARVAEVIRGLQFHSMEFLKLQVKFARTGQYRSSDAEAIEREIYQVGEKMQQYLDGLLLTYVAWPNHLRVLRWYRSAYLARGPSGRCLEIGPGHGYLALEQLRASDDSTLTALDLSPHSVAYTRDLLRVNGIAPERYDVRQTNAQAGLDTDISRFDRIVIAEVIEHVSDPLAILRGLVARSHEQTSFFVTTVVNIEAPDHIYLFRTVGEVRDLLAAAGLAIEDELALPMEMNLELPRPAYEVAMVCRPAYSSVSQADEAE